MKVSKKILAILAPKAFGVVLPVNNLEGESFKLFDIIKKDDIELNTSADNYTADEIKDLRRMRLVFSNSKDELVIFPISSYLNFLIKIGNSKPNLILNHLEDEIRDFKIIKATPSSTYPLSSYEKYEELIVEYFLESPDGDFEKFHKLNPSLRNVCVADGRLKDGAEPYKKIIAKLL